MELAWTKVFYVTLRMIGDSIEKEQYRAVCRWFFYGIIFWEQWPGSTWWKTEYSSLCRYHFTRQLMPLFTNVWLLKKQNKNKGNLLTIVEKSNWLLVVVVVVFSAEWSRHLTVSKHIHFLNIVSMTANSSVCRNVFY